MSAIRNKTFLVLAIEQLHQFLNTTLILISYQRLPTAIQHSEGSQLRPERIVRSSRRT